jgi:hypothetical protein
VANKADLVRSDGQMIFFEALGTELLQFGALTGGSEELHNDRVRIVP